MQGNFRKSEEDLIAEHQLRQNDTRDQVSGSNRSGVSDANQSTINSRRPGRLSIEQGCINCVVQVQVRIKI